MGPPRVITSIFYVADYHRLIAPPRVHDIPCWLVNGYSTPTFPAVVPDDLWGQAQAVDYLVTQGHRKLAYVGLDANLEAGRLRREGFLHAAHAAGIKSEQLHVQSGTQRGEKTPFSLLKTVLHGLLQQAHPPSVICFGNDQMALTAIPIIESLGLRMPEDVSIMGFDNDIAIALAARPKLTTVALPYQRMGQVAAKGLLQQLNGVNAEVDYPLKIRGEVVERDSVKNRNETRI